MNPLHVAQAQAEVAYRHERIRTAFAAGQNERAAEHERLKRAARKARTIHALHQTHWSWLDMMRAEAELERFEEGR